MDAFKIYQGTTWTKTLNKFDEAGEPDDYTTGSAVFQIRKAPAVSGAEAFVTLDSYDPGVDLSVVGEITFGLTPEQTDQLAADLYEAGIYSARGVELDWELKLEKAGDITSVKGKVNFFFEIADYYEEEE